MDIEAVYRAESRRVLATLIRLIGDFDRAEEALHDAFLAAADQWPREGMPTNPRAWLVSAGRFKAIDRIRKRARFQKVEQEILALSEEAEELPPDPEPIADDRLRLIFVCCHPVLPAAAQVALTLREVVGLTTEEVASALLARPSAVAQRIVRAKAKLKEDAIRYEVPEAPELPGRLESVLRVIYLLFNEGYSASSGESVTRPLLSSEAIRLARLLVELLPDREAAGLLALLLLNDSRRTARMDKSGDLVLLDAQDRSLWDQAEIIEGLNFARAALARPPFGPYALQAAIAAAHATAPSPDATDWNAIVGYYDLLGRADPNPVISLNRAVAVAMRDGPQAGLDLIDPLMAKLEDYRFAHAARADLLRRLGRDDEARASYLAALELTRQGPERRFLEKRLQELG
jgi:RNA polymerase sigma-70 factor (ECF subfamily)